MLDIDVQIGSDWAALEFDASSWVTRAARAAFEGGMARRHPDAHSPAPRRIDVLLTGNVEIRRINHHHRGVDKPTNVLAFPAPADIANWTGPGEAPPLGDIVIALGTLRQEALARGIPEAHHLAHLTVHGTLHLIGFDHRDDAEARDMETLETEILIRLGVPGPYELEAAHG